MIVQPWCVKEDSPMRASEWIIRLLYSLEMSENHRFSDGLRGGAESNSALQIRAGQRSITANLWPLTALIYHVMNIVTRGFPKKCFYYYFRKQQYADIQNGCN